MGVTPNFGLANVLANVRALPDKLKVAEIERDIAACYDTQPGCALPPRRNPPAHILARS